MRRDQEKDEEGKDRTGFYGHSCLFSQFPSF